MYFIAYVKQKLKNHVSVFTGNCDQEDIQMKDSMNWKETQLVYPLLGFFSAKTSEQVVSFICNTTSLCMMRLLSFKNKVLHYIFLSIQPI